MILLAACSAMFAQPHSAALAGPARPEPFELTQPNGTGVMAYAIGDEHGHSIVTGDGYTLIQDSTGFWTYATLDPAGHLVAGDRRAGLDVPPPLALQLRAARDERHSANAINAINAIQATHQARYNATGRQPVLILLVQFTDQPPIGTTFADWQRTFFDPADSIAAYYRDVSQGVLQLVPAAESFGTANDGIVGWVTLPYPHPNTNAIGAAVRKVAQDAAAAADPYVNYASFDTNGDGALSSSELHFAVVFAGYEGSYSPANKCGNAVWGHRANLSGLTTLDNVNLLNSGDDSGYAGIGEWHCDSTDRPGHASTIGPIVHEIGHDLGLPDLYDTDNSTYGAGTWSPMALGAWNTAAGRLYGQLPAHHDAFSRSYLGWVTPTLVSSSQTSLTLQPAETTGQVLQFIANPSQVDWEFRYQSGTGEYYLVENRQRLGYDAGLIGCGLLVWHVAESAPPDNTANADDELRLLSLQQADGLDQLNKHENTGDQGDPFPGTSGSTLFGRFTKPGSILHTGAFSGITLTNILAGNADCPTSRNTASLQVSTPANTTLSLAAAPAALAVDFSIRMTAIIEGNALPPTPTPTPTATPRPATLDKHIYLPLLQR